jgi:hypothetical protein
MQVTGSNERNSHRVTDSHRSPNSSRVMVRAFASCRLGKLGDHVASNTFSFFLKKKLVSCLDLEEKNPKLPWAKL